MADSHYRLIRRYDIRQRRFGRHNVFRPEHPEAELDVQAVLDLVYARAGYHLILDYPSEPTPPLTEEQRKWAGEIMITQKANA